MKHFFALRVLIYIFFIIHIILSINKVEVFPIFGWNLYPNTSPYALIYIVKVTDKNHKQRSLHDYIGHNKYYINRILINFGARLDKHKHRKNSKEFKRAKTQLEKYILRITSAPFSYSLVKQRVNLPLYVLSKKGYIVSEKKIMEGRMTLNAEMD